MAPTVEAETSGTGVNTTDRGTIAWKNNFINIDRHKSLDCLMKTIYFFCMCKLIHFACYI